MRARIREAWRLPALGGLLAAAAWLLALPGLIPAQEQKKGSLVSLDGLSSRAPAEWKEVNTQRQFRYKEFSLPRVGDDKYDAELIIFYFGQGGGGGVEENIARWKGIFQPPPGKDIDQVTKREEFRVGDVKVTYLDISGTYLYRPFPMAPRAEPRPDHRMIAVIFESPKGPYYFRLVGPEKTVSQHKPAFDEWLRNFK
jgi:hypothetical protein